MPRSATGHRHRRWSLRHPGQPHQPPRSWPYDQSCTNIQPGPPSEGRPANTLARLRTCQREVLGPLVAKHHGRIVNSPGDSALCEFASVVDAVACAMAIQHGMAEREAGVPEAERVRLRIGINLGDVIVEGEDIYGDGVNVAARLEGLAEPGGVCVSSMVREELRGRLPLAFEDLGEQRLKNIAQSVKAYRVTPRDAPAADPATGAP